uniref:amphiphysin isoform X9 n=1 Tax=Arvicanthis niloticus TaxID=61156 RepID=UPI0014871B72|nr:amphiphysin isoform X9 [Arvicanthis niloticus]
MWGCVETYQRVDNGAIDIKAIEGTEGFEEKVCDSPGNPALNHLKKAAEEGQETLESSEVESWNDLKMICKERLETYENYFEEAHLLERTMRNVCVTEKLDDRIQELSDEMQVIINHKKVEGSGATPANHTGISNLPILTDPVSIIKDSNNGELDLTKKEMIENFSRVIKLPRTERADSWGTDPDQVWQSDLKSGINDVNIVKVSDIPDGHTSTFAKWQESNTHWHIRDIEGLHRCWEHLVENEKGLEENLPAEVCGKHTSVSNSDQSQETTRQLGQGTSQNTSMESPDSSQDNDINNSDLSEDEIANQRYGLLYQEIEADKIEASGGSFNDFTQPQDTSLFTMQTDQNMAETEQALSTEPQAEEPPATAAAPTAGMDLGLEMEEPKEEAVVILHGVIPQESELAAFSSIHSRIPPGTDAGETVETTVPTEGAPVEEAEAEKAALPSGEGESPEGAKRDAESTELASSESPQPTEAEAGAPQEKVIPSVVIEPASNHEGEGEHQETAMGIETREASEDVAPQGPAGEKQELATEPTPLDSQAATPAPAGAVDASLSAGDATQELPPGFLYKVETLHDFEAANSDELTLQRGDVVLVVPSDSEADQDAGWLVGVKESDWLQYRDLATYKGLFPENFTRRLE